MGKQIWTMRWSGSRSRLRATVLHWFPKYVHCGVSCHVRFTGSYEDMFLPPVRSDLALLRLVSLREVVKLSFSCSSHSHRFISLHSFGSCTCYFCPYKALPRSSSDEDFFSHPSCQCRLLSKIFPQQSWLLKSLSLYFLSWHSVFLYNTYHKCSIICSCIL